MKILNSLSFTFVFYRLLHRKYLIETAIFILTWDIGSSVYYYLIVIVVSIQLSNIVIVVEKLSSFMSIRTKYDLLKKNN